MLFPMYICRYEYVHICKHLIKKYENSFSANCLLKTEHSMLIIENTIYIKGETYIYKLGYYLVISTEKCKNNVVIMTTQGVSYKNKLYSNNVGLYIITKLRR